MDFQLNGVYTLSSFTCSEEMFAEIYFIEAIDFSRNVIGNKAIHVVNVDVKKKVYDRIF